MERQGQLGDLRGQSREQLRDLLLRQEKIVSNKRLVQTLPDKGEKIREFAERIRFAIEHHDEEERKRSLVSAARAELESKYQQAFTMQRSGAQRAPAAAMQSEASTGSAEQGKETSPVSMQVQENHSLDKHDKSAAVEAMETAAAVAAAAEASLNLGGTKEKDLAEALERVSLTETAGTGFTLQTKDPLKTKATENYFVRQQTPKKPHYVTLLERTEATHTKQRFKPNQHPNKSDKSPSGSSSPSQSSEGSSPLSAQARRERDRKHLNDITAAKLPPLHHNPAQLLSLQESAVLLKEQTKRQQELHAKLAAQKLSEGLKVSMGSYTPDGSSMAAYREVHDEGAQLSSEED